MYLQRPYFIRYFLIVILIIILLNYFRNLSSHSRNIARNSTIKPILVTTNETLESATEIRLDLRNAKDKIKFGYNPYGTKQCENYSKILVENGFFEPIPLVSYPGSGNTWLRHLLELSTGYFTGSIYNDAELYGRGFIGEMELPDAGSTIIQKTHLKYSPMLNVSKAILLIRDPYLAITAFVQYLEGGHIGPASSFTFKRKGWEPFLLSQVYKWITLAKTWIDSSVDLYVLHYERLKLDPEQILLSLCKFLNVECKYIHTDCFKSHLEGSFHRKKHFQVKPKVSKEVQKKINRGINYLNNILISQGYGSLPLELYSFYQNVASS